MGASTTITDRKGISQIYLVCERTVQAWDERGLIPRIKIGRLVRYDINKVAAALAKFERVAK